MNSQKSKKLIITLIKNDLLNQKFILGLQATGIDAGMYCLYLSDTIFMLMGFKKEEMTTELYDRYAKMAHKVLQIDISESYEPLEGLARKVYKKIRKYANVRV